MRILYGYVKATVIGGLTFMIPVLVMIFIFGKAMGIAAAVARPISEKLPVDSLAGVAIVNILSILLIVIICLLAGVLARKAFGMGIARALESKLDLVYPRYAVIKAMTQSLRDDDDSTRLVPVVARFDDNAQIGLEVDRSDDGLVTVFMPGSPDPWAGTVVHMPENRIHPVDADMLKVSKALKALGRGTSQMIPSADVMKAFAESES